MYNNNVPNYPRIGYRPNIYGRPNTNSNIPPPGQMPPRRPLPTTMNRMLKPGFEPVSRNLPVTPRGPDRTPTERKELPPVNPFPLVSKFMYTDEELQNTPSRRLHNIKFDEEMTLRRVGTCFIRELMRRIYHGDKNKQVRNKANCAMCTAMIYFQRFYMFHSLATFQPTHVGTACLFLAAKCEDCPRKLEEFSVLMFFMTHPDEREPPKGRELESWKDLITTIETCILKTIAFELEINIPQAAIIEASFPSTNDDLRKMAFAMSTDLLTFTTLSIQYEAKEMAAACYYVASCYLDIDMDANYGSGWYRRLKSTLTEEIILKIAGVFCKALEEMKPVVQARQITAPNQPPVNVPPSVSHPPDLKPLSSSSGHDQRRHPQPNETRQHGTSYSSNQKARHEPNGHIHAPIIPPLIPPPTRPIDRQRHEERTAAPWHEDRPSLPKHDDRHQLPRREERGSFSRHDEKPSVAVSAPPEISFPSLLPPPLPPPNSELRKRKTPLADEPPPAKTSRPHHSERSLPAAYTNPQYVERHRHDSSSSNKSHSTSMTHSSSAYQFSSNTHRSDRHSTSSHHHRSSDQHHYKDIRYSSTTTVTASSSIPRQGSDSRKDNKPPKIYNRHAPDDLEEGEIE